MKSFISRFSNISFEIIDESYNYNTAYFNGYLRADGEDRECMISIYHLGDMIYVEE